LSYRGPRFREEPVLVGDDFEQAGKGFEELTVPKEIRRV
jgi:hypothetical protein